MKTSVEFLDAVKASHHLPNDNQLANFLGCTRSSISNYRGNMNRRAFLLMVLFLLLCARLSARQANAAEWSDADLHRESAFLSLQIVDYLQTRHIAELCRDPGTWHEQNVILGNCPSAGSVDRYFLITTLLQVGVSNFLPADLRRDFQNVTIVVEVGAVSNNYSLGISAQF